MAKTTTKTPANRTAKFRLDGSSKKPQAKFTTSDIRLPGEDRPLHSAPHDILYQDVWLAQAGLLIDAGHFQQARDFLYESMNAARTFDERYTLAKAQYLLSRIALFDNNFMEARSYASSAQKTAVDETFWFDCVCVLVEGHRLDGQDKQGYEKSVQILTKCVRLVKAEKGCRRNKASRLEWIEAMLEFKLGEVTAEGQMAGRLSEGDVTRAQKMGRRSLKQNTMHASLFKKLSAVCEVRSQELFLVFGFILLN